MTVNFEGAIALAVNKVTYFMRPYKKAAVVKKTSNACLYMKRFNKTACMINTDVVLYSSSCLGTFLHYCCSREIKDVLSPNYRG